MKISNHIYKENGHWYPSLPEENTKTQLLLCFGEEDLLFDQQQTDIIKKAFPNSVLTGCTTAGNIHNDGVQDNSLTLTAIEFEKTHIHIISEPVFADIDSLELGKRLARGLLEKPELQHVIIMTEGLMIKGDALAIGLSDTLPKGIAVTGGMASKGTAFEDTRVWLNDSGPTHQVVAIGLYGKHLEIGYGSKGGFDSFGPKRKITRAIDNMLYELDGQSALELYKDYLADNAKDLPSSGLQFPLMLSQNNSEQGIVRTVQGIDETNQSMEFAGNLPEGQYVQLMRANYDRLIDGAFQAAKSAKLAEDAELALLISCVGRRVVLQNRVDEEIEDARDALGDNTIFTGFYSYGELCPLDEQSACLLHNQTMTITTLREI